MINNSDKVFNKLSSLLKSKWTSLKKINGWSHYDDTYLRRCLLIDLCKFPWMGVWSPLPLSMQVPSHLHMVFARTITTTTRVDPSARRHSGPHVRSNTLSILHQNWICTSIQTEIRKGSLGFSLPTATAHAWSKSLPERKKRHRGC